MKNQSNLLDFQPGDPTGGVGMGGDPAAAGIDTTTLSDQDLAALAGDVGAQGEAPPGTGMPAPDAAAGGVGGQMDPEAMQVEELQAQLDDPNLDPQTRQDLQMQLALAARRRLAGLGGDLGAGGMQ